MKQYNEKFATKEYLLSLTKDRKPDFENVISALKKETPKRPTLFELFLNDDLFEELIDEKCPAEFISKNKFLVKGFRACGYDYVTISCPPELLFLKNELEHKETISLNEGYIITDETSFNNYNWPDYKNYDYSYLLQENLNLSQGMKVIILSGGGVLENLIAILGYDNLCIMLFEKPDFVKKIADKIGQCLYDYYCNCLKFDTVGACFINDDWGYKTQTMLSPKDLRKYIIPWHKKISSLIHEHNKYSILHSCGMLWEVMDDIIYDIKADAKHSYEDAITPVEDSYKRLKGKIAVIGGIDVDFMCNKSSKEVYDRAINLLIQTKTDGGYLLGTGNSVPEYIPNENLFAMLCAALDNEY